MLAESTKDGVISKHCDGTTAETPRGGNNWNLRADKLRSTSATSDVSLPSHDPCGILKTIVSDARIYKMGIITNSRHDYRAWCFLYRAMISKEKKSILL
jgi:hypothetical protein